MTQRSRDLLRTQLLPCTTTELPRPDGRVNGALIRLSLIEPVAYRPSVGPGGAKVADKGWPFPAIPELSPLLGLKGLELVPKVLLVGTKVLKFDPIWPPACSTNPKQGLARVELPKRGGRRALRLRNNLIPSAQRLPQIPTLRVERASSLPHARLPNRLNRSQELKAITGPVAAGSRSADGYSRPSKE